MKSRLSLTNTLAFSLEAFYFYIAMSMMLCMKEGTYVSLYLMITDQSYLNDFEVIFEAWIFDNIPFHILIFFVCFLLSAIFNYIENMTPWWYDVNNERNQ